MLSNGLKGMTPFYRFAVTVNPGLLSVGAGLAVESGGSLDSVDLVPDTGQGLGVSALEHPSGL